MKPSLWLPLFASVILFSSCTNQTDPNDPNGYGPFDSAGNYREDWADDPSMWTKPGKRKPAASLFAAKDEPPADSIPLVTSADAHPQPLITSTAQPKPSATTTAVSTRPVTKPKATVATKPKAKPKTVAKAKPKPKLKAKAKPQPKRYIVKSGDSLARIASRNGTTVSALQRANGISGSLIRPGQKLVIPK